MDGLSDCWWMPGKAFCFGGTSSGARLTTNLAELDGGDQQIEAGLLKDKPR
jgi:hypothetical protein